LPVVVLLTIAGLQVPVIPLVEVVGKIGAVAPLQMDEIAANVVVTGLVHASETQVALLLVKHPVPIGKIVIFTVAFVPKAFTVKVFVFNVAGLIGAPPFIVYETLYPVAPATLFQLKVTEVRVDAPQEILGELFGFTVTETDAGAAHCPAFGVNVYVPDAVLFTVVGLQVPEMPLVEFAGKMGAVLPLQKAGMLAKVGVIIGFTVTDKDAVVAHCPAVAVNVYVPEVVLLTVAGFQVPVIPLFEVVGNIGAVAPLQIAGIEVNVGVVGAFTVTERVVVVAHCPAVGVKVYVPVVVLLTVAGNHVPVLEFVDVVCNIGAVAPLQMAGIDVNAGTIFGFTVTLKVVVVAHCPFAGVKV
jgi:hypothetical protein